MRKTLVLILIFLTVLSTLSMGRSLIFEDDLDEDHYLDNPMWSNFSFYRADMNNFVFDGANGFYEGKWTEGASAFYLDPLSDYTFSFDFKSNGNTNLERNCYKSAIAIRVDDESFVFEPDNGDDDPTSFLGSSGIYFYCYDNILEIAIHTKEKGGIGGPVNIEEGEDRRMVVDKAEDRYFGVYSTSYIMELGKEINFNKFTQVKIVDAKDLIEFYIGEEKICQIELSDEYEVETFVSETYHDTAKHGSDVFSGLSYNTVILKDNEGTKLMTVKESVVAKEGRIGFLNRANGYFVDNIRIEYNYEPTPEPTKEPKKTVETKEPKATGEPIEKEESNVLVYVFAGLGLLVIVFAILILIRQGKSLNRENYDK